MDSSNTLNDIQYDDANITRATRREQQTPQVPGDEYDYVVSFFTKIMKDPSAAKNFAESIYQVARATRTPVLQLVESMKDFNNIQVNETMAFYLNSIRSPSTLLGVQNTIKPNYYAGRNVLS